SFFFLSKGIVVFLSIILIFPSSWLIYKLYKADKRKDFKWLSSWAKIIMLLGILSIFFVDTFLGKLFS
ncbi:MAG: hypothetical protein SFU27_12230, partial [Thermonemataceae bacterium]|nr:hypothetical protein [Thermonemataceae bacterium]